MRRLLLSIAALALLAAGAAYTAPRAGDALSLRLAADEPERLATLRLAQALDAGAVAREIEAALEAGDAELAESFVSLADAQRIEIAPALRARVEAGRSAAVRVRQAAARFGRGFVTGEADGVEGFAGATTGDLLVYGDLRDLAREGAHWWRGKAIDPMMAGLAAAGLAVTAGTYFASGAAAPARTGVSLFKAVRRTGKMSAGLAADAGRLARAGGGARALAAFADLGRIEAKAGARAAVEGLRHADNLAELGKVSRLAEKNGRATLAILKTLGRGAFVLGAGALSGALWVMGAATNIFLLVIAVCTAFAQIVRWLWRGGRLAWRVTKIAAAT